jgi:glycosyltransferase involved in cell wall biosynthesis
MRILCVTSYYKPAYIYGGPARSIPLLCEGLAKAGTEVAVFTTNANGQSDLDVPAHRPIEIDGVLVNYFQRSHLAPNRYFYAPDLGKACWEHIRNFDIVYICGTWTYPLLPAARAAREADVPYIISPRGSFMTWSMQQKGLKKRLYLLLVERGYMNNATALHCTSKPELEQIKHWRFKPPTALIPNGVDLSVFRTLPPRGKLRQSLGISETVPVSLFIGRLHKEKRLPRLISVFSKVVKPVRDTHLLIVGGDEDHTGTEIREQVKQMGLSGQVHFTGLLTEDALLQAYTDADVFVLLSYRESFGMVAVEAMATGLPILISSDVGIASEVKQQGAGIVVDAESPHVEEAWRDILLSPEKRREMGEAGKRLAWGHFSSQSVARQMLGLFNQMIEGQHKKGIDTNSIYEESS